MGSQLIWGPVQRQLGTVKCWEHSLFTSMTIWPARVAVTVELWPLASSATANRMEAALAPRAGSSSLGRHKHDNRIRGVCYVTTRMHDG